MTRIYTIGVIVTAVLPFFSTATEPSKTRCDYQWDSITKKAYKFHNIPANWHAAQLRCYLEGATIATPLNKDMNDVIMEAIKSNNPPYHRIYTGLHATFSRDFYTAEGYPPSAVYLNWQPYRPDNTLNNERCVTMARKGLDDVNCAVAFPYMCYFSSNKDATETECGTLDKGYTYRQETGKCYKFHGDVKTWHRAHMHCRAELGQLVVIKSNTEAKVLKEIFKKNPPETIRPHYLKHKDVVFVGFSDWFEHSAWAWRTIEGKTIEKTGYSTFSENKAENSTTDHFCGAIGRDAKLSNFKCNEPAAFICEKEPYFEDPCDFFSGTL